MKIQGAVDWSYQQKGMLEATASQLQDRVRGFPPEARPCWSAFLRCGFLIILTPCPAQDDYPVEQVQILTGDYIFPRPSAGLESSMKNRMLLQRLFMQ